MKIKNILTVFFLTVLCGVSVAQTDLPLPPQATTFTGLTRGYFFQCPQDLTITSVGVPTDASSLNQSVAIITMAAPPPAFPGTILPPTYTVEFLDQNVPGAAPIAVNIPVTAGTYIGVLGSRGPNSINSYGQPNPFNTTLLGDPVSLARMGIQTDLQFNFPFGVWTEASPPNNNIGRVNLSVQGAGGPGGGGNDCLNDPCVTVTCPPDITVACIDEVDLDPTLATATTSCSTGGGGASGTVNEAGNPNASWSDFTTGLVVSQNVNVTAPAGATVSDVNISLGIDHSWTGDLTIELIAPDGTSATLLQSACGNDSNVNATFDDSGVAQGCTGYDGNPFAEQCNNDNAVNAAIGGTIQPVDALSVFDGVDANGNWTIEITDGVGGDGGCLTSFDLEVSYGAAAVPNTIVGQWVTNPDISGVPGCPGTTYTYLYKAVDSGGNIGCCARTITIDNTPPVLTIPPNQTVSCIDEIEVNVNDAEVTNTCAAFNLYLAPPVVNGPIGCPGTTYEYTYRVIDACGRTVEATQVFTQGNTAGPTITAPDDITCECFAGVNPNPDYADVTSACDAGFDVQVSGPQIIGPMDCPGTRYIYTYTVTDDCGRTATDQQTFTINNGPPVFQNCPDDNWLVLNCEDYGGEEGTIAVIEAWIASVTATNSCGMGLTVFNNFNSNNIGTCINDGYTTVTFRATDNCGRTSFCTGTVVVIDTEAPMIVEEAQDHYEVCNYLTQENLDDWVDANGGAVAFDGCSNEQVFWSTIPNNPTINCAGQMGTTEVTVTFVARDNCGNKSETTATFYALMATNDLVQDNGPADLNNEVSGLSLDQNRPNPFKDETLISFSLPEATSATLTIFDVNGRMLKSFQGDYAEGYNEVSINRSELGATGVMYYQLTTDHGSITKTMLVID